MAKVNFGLSPVLTICYFKHRGLMSFLLRVEQFFEFSVAIEDADCPPENPSYQTMKIPK